LNQTKRAICGCFLLHFYFRASCWIRIVPLSKRQPRQTGRTHFAASRRLRIGDDWNAITIIALPQDNPLKAVAEFVENSIDAGASTITITRGRERGEHYLMVAHDGGGVPKDADGAPDFRFVATHIRDSIKRQLKAGDSKGIQDEFSIGLLSFWTVGEELAMTSSGTDGRVCEVHMRKGDPRYKEHLR
jgi:hypothetical protein